MIHSIYTITEIALRYYAITVPERKYSRHYAIRQWRQDKYIDKKILLKVLTQAFNEQKQMLKYNDIK